jgi:signal transduction histidine kinase
VTILHIKSNRAAVREEFVLTLVVNMIGMAVPAIFFRHVPVILVLATAEFLLYLALGVHFLARKERYSTEVIKRLMVYALFPLQMGTAIVFLSIIEPGLMFYIMGTLLVLVMIYNQLRLQSQVLNRILLAAVVVTFGVALFIPSPAFTKYIQGFLALLLVVIGRVLSNALKDISHEIGARDEIITKMELDLRSRQVASAISLHDINNHLHLIGGALELAPPDERTDRMVRMGIQGIQNSLKIAEEAESRLLLSKTVIGICRTYPKRVPVDFELGEGLEVHLRYRLTLLASILINLLDNSIEAACRRGQERARIRFHVEGRTLCLTDDCGGFDHAKIGDGVSSKAERGHGKFLHALTGNAEVFKVDTRFETAPGGTKVCLTFHPGVIAA